MKLGNFRAYSLGAVSCLAGFLFGYDSGVVGGVLTLTSFQDDFRYTTKQATKTNSIAVGIQQASALVGCFLVWPVTNKFGRRSALMICSFVFCVGAILQTVNSHSLPVFYVGRVIAGIGLGGSSVIVTMFTSEMSPKEIRGRLGSFYQLMYTFGIFLSYWVDYAVTKTISPSSRQWQIPIGLQIAPAALFGLGMLTLKESVRWLVKNNRHEDAWESLSWIRADSSEETRRELLEIQDSVEHEKHAKEGLRFTELAERDNLSRTAIGFCIMLCQQSVGSSALAYFGPQFFSLLVGAGEKDLLLTAIFGAVKIVACGIFVIFFSERIGRRKALIGGALFMSACMITTAVVDKVLPPPGGGVTTSSGIATVALIYLNIMTYNFSWGPLPWPLISELFPTRIRDIGVAIAVASQWLFNFVYSFSTPYMMASMGWGTFLLFGCFDICVALFAFFVLKETRGKSLEEVEKMYGSLNHKSGDVEWRASISKTNEDI